VAGSSDVARIAPADAPVNPSRGIPLAGLPRVDGWFELIVDRVEADAAREVWERAVVAPAWPGAPLWLHGDLHPSNVVVRDGTLAGVIDFGDMCSGELTA
jgi:aminoglycoside phosphotransferase (APT) family kinase protein